MKEIAFSWYSLALVLWAFTLREWEFLQVFCKFVSESQLYLWGLSIANIDV
jgi:hypothetical protein